MRGLGVVLCALALVAAACSSGETSSQTQAPTEPQTTEPQATETSGGGGIELRLVADGLDSPLGIASTPSEPDRLYIVEQPGLVRVVEDGKLLPQPFLDVEDQVVSGGEQGLLSLAFDPEYESTRLFYVDYTDTNGDTRVVEYEAGDSATVKRRELLFVDQPYANHNGGQLAFGPDGQLYIGMGDGGSGGDPNNNGQTFATKLAKLWKIDANDPNAEPQLVAYGLRNPWRFSFDRLTGDLYIGDVGQGSWEEIDYYPKALLNRLVNFGWAVYEGRVRYNRSRTLDGRAPYRGPVQVYSHALGCSVTGGFVYRGNGTRTWRGRYFYGDYCSVAVLSFRIVKGKVAALRRESFTIPSLTSFGEDSRGGLYAVSHRGKIYRLAS